MEPEKIVFVDENGVQTELKILFTYHSDEKNKNYVVFFDENDDELLAGIIDEKGNVLDIETDEEYDEIEEQIDLFYEEQNQ